MIEKEYLKISEVSAAIEAAVSSAFPREIWVLGEIQGLDRNRHRGHWYFELCETTEGGETFRLAATLWKGIRSRLFGPGGKCAGVFDLDGPLDGTKILALCRVDFYPPYGKVSLHVQDIDTDYTLGELEARRKALLERLKKEDALERNARLPMPEVPLTVGLVTSEGSAAYNDFINELANAGMGFRVLLCDARMQGEEALETVPAAFRALARRQPDVIALVRGGGSRLDLSWFDREEIVYAVVDCGCPVVTGIGHEIDVTLSQMTAHSGMKTPTAAAAFIVERAARYTDAVNELGESLAREAVERIRRERESLGKEGERLRLGCRYAAAEAEHGLRDLGRRISAAAVRGTGRAAESLADYRNRLAAGRHVFRLNDVRMEVERLVGRLAELVVRIPEREGRRLELLAEKRRLLDPAQVIRRGFALVRGDRGKIIKSVAGLAAGRSVDVTLRDGRLRTEIKEIVREEQDGEEEDRQLEIW